MDISTRKRPLVEQPTLHHWFGINIAFANITGLATNYSISRHLNLNTVEVNVKDGDVSTRKIGGKDCNRLPEVFKVAVEVEALPGERGLATEVVST